MLQPIPSSCHTHYCPTFATRLEGTNPSCLSHSPENQAIGAQSGDDKSTTDPQTNRLAHIYFVSKWCFLCRSSIENHWLMMQKKRHRTYQCHHQQGYAGTSYHPATPPLQWMA